MQFEWEVSGGSMQIVPNFTQQQILVKHEHVPHFKSIYLMVLKLFTFKFLENLPDFYGSYHKGPCI